MKAGIIAAGDGARFRAAGVTVPKPMIEVGGMTLIERTLRSLVAAGADEIVLIVNHAGGEVLAHVEALGLPVALRPLRKSTAGSFASLVEIARLLDEGPFLLSTVDTVAAGMDASRFAAAFRAGEPDALLACTDFVDDEKPLRIALDDDGRVKALGPEATASPFVTAGLYGLGPRAVAAIAPAAAAGLTRLRDFLGRLVQGGLDVRGHHLGVAIDVDRPHDLEVAERYLRSLEPARCA